MFAVIRSELIKLRHTPYWIIHAVVPLLGAILFVGYFLLYSSTDNTQKLKLIAEVTAMVFPLLISVVVGLNMLPEEKASKFQNLLEVPDRKSAFLSKLTVLFLSGMSSLMVLFLFFTIGVAAFSEEILPGKILLLAFFGLSISSLILYVWHMFLHLKVGVGISLFFGVFECLLYILCSNVELPDVWCYLPFSWSANWINGMFHGYLAEQGMEWAICIILTISCLVLVLGWFSHWEGRKNE